MPTSRRTVLSGFIGLSTAILFKPRSAFAQNATALINAARAQIGVTRLYDGSYSRIPYPDGDIERLRGVCSDVIIRAYRDAFGFDLQKEVHEDMRAHFRAYPKMWGLAKPDSNIDHRRVPNLQTYLARKNARLAPKATPETVRPGDLVTQMINGNLPHIAIISDRKGPDGIPLVIHNIGGGTQEENRLMEFPHTGHYRFYPL